MFKEAFAWVREERPNERRPDLAALNICEGDPRSLGHTGRGYPPGKLPAHIPVGFKCECRALAFVLAHLTTTMSGVELERRVNELGDGGGADGVPEGFCGGAGSSRGRRCRTDKRPARNSSSCAARAAPRKAVSVIVGGNFANRILLVILDLLGFCIIEGQGGQDSKAVKQVGDQDFDHPGNAGLLLCQQAGSLVRL